MVFRNEGDGIRCLKLEEIIFDLTYFFRSKVHVSSHDKLFSIKKLYWGRTLFGKRLAQSFVQGIKGVYEGGK